MTRLLKCYGICDEKYSKEELIKEGGKNYCKPCLTTIKKEREERDLLYKTIQIVYNIPYPTGQMLKQISDFKKDRNYSYEDINKTICYFVKVMKKVPTIHGALSFIPWYYDKSISYYIELERRKNNMKDIKTDNVTVLKISNYSTVDTREPIVKKRFVEMGDILNDG